MKLVQEDCMMRVQKPILHALAPSILKLTFIKASIQSGHKRSNPNYFDLPVVSIAVFSHFDTIRFALWHSHKFLKTPDLSFFNARLLKNPNIKTRRDFKVEFESDSHDHLL